MSERLVCTKIRPEYIRSFSPTEILNIRMVCNVLKDLSIDLNTVIVSDMGLRYNKYNNEKQEFINNNLNLYLVYFIIFITYNENIVTNLNSLKNDRNLVPPINWLRSNTIVEASSFNVLNNVLNNVLTCLFLESNTFLETFLLSHESKNTLPIPDDDMFKHTDDTHYGNVLKLQDLLKIVTKHIRNIQPVENINEINKKIVKSIKEIIKIEILGYNDPSNALMYDFIMSLSLIFIPKFMVFKSSTINIDNNMEILKITDIVNIIINVPSYLEVKNIEDYITKYKDSYDTENIIEIFNYIPFLIFTIDREQKRPLKYPPTIIKKNVLLRLHSVIVYNSALNKYKSYLRFKDNWFVYYDSNFYNNNYYDVENIGYTKIEGSRLTNIMEIDIEQNSSMFFYTEY